MNDRVKRTLRTFVQGFLGVFAGLGIATLISWSGTVAGGGDIDVDLNFWGNVVLASCGGGLVAVITFVQNLFEDKTGTDLLPK